MSEGAPSRPVRGGELASPHTVFRPDSFFLQPFRGWGVTRDRRGAVLRKFVTEGSGRLDVRSRSAWNELTITFGDGHVDRMAWEIVSDDEGHFVGIEHEKKLKAEGQTRGEAFCWRFKVPLPNGRSGDMQVDYVLISDSAATSRAVLRTFGLTLSVTDTFYHHV